MQIQHFFSELKSHIKTDFNLFAYSYVFIVAIIFLSINFSVDFERKVIYSFYGKPIGILVYILYYAIPYYTGSIPFLILKKQGFKVLSCQFWLKSILFLSIIGTFSSLSLHSQLAEQIGSNRTETDYLTLLFTYLKRVIPYLITLFLIYHFIDKQTVNFYGLAKTDISYRPFYFMLLLVLPLVTAASFLPDFQSYYPRFKYWKAIQVFDFSKLQMNLLFLICYGMDFISVELIFRGALVIGMVSVLGREAVLPMAFVYMVLHFGKPIGEAISSFFGGYFLGVLSYNHKNIRGGIIVHIGLAWMMELAAILQHIRLNNQ